MFEIQRNAWALLSFDKVINQFHQYRFHLRFYKILVARLIALKRYFAVRKFSTDEKKNSTII